MKATQGKRGQQPAQQKNVPIITACGTPAFVNPNDIAQGKWNHHHGETASGQKVNSMQTTMIGDSILLRTGNGGPTLSVTQAEFEVAAAQILTGMGYTLQVPQGH